MIINLLKENSQYVPVAINQVKYSRMRMEEVKLVKVRLQNIYLFGS